MRSKWLEWEPQQKIIEKAAGQAPTKPTEPTFEGFVGSVSRQIPIIQAQEGTIPQVQPGPANGANRQLTSDLRPVERGGLPPNLAGVRLVSWEPKNPPIAIIHMGVVTDVDRFIMTTLNELEARLQGRDFLAGNRSLRELVERLEQVGVKVEITHIPPVAEQPPFNVEEMLVVETRINAGLDVAPKLLVEYRRWIAWLDKSKAVSTRLM